jgi:hypothetical protein
MTAATLRLLNPEDGLCLLLPAQWLESDYAAKLRERIWSMDNRRVELHLFTSDLFEDAQVDAVALLVGVETDTAQPLVLGSDRGTKRKVKRNPAEVPLQWRVLFENRKMGARGEPRTGGLLRDFAIVKRGVATGDNSFFVINDSLQREHALPRSVLRPLVRRLRDLPNTCTNDVLDELEERHYLLVANKRQLATLKHLQDYIAIGVERKTSERLLCQRRPDWFDLSAEVFVPDVIIGPMTKDSFRLVENHAGAVVTNNLYGITWRRETSAETRAAILGWLRSAVGQSALTEGARTQGEGLFKIEPRALSELRLPAQFRPLAETLL